MSYRNLESAEFEAELKNNNDVILIDCRPSEMFNEGHLANAINYTYSNGKFESMIPSMDKDKNYLLYCRSGASSEASAKLLSENGFKNVSNLLGGIMNWKGEVV